MHLLMNESSTARQDVHQREHLVDLAAPLGAPDRLTRNAELAELVERSDAELALEQGEDIWTVGHTSPGCHQPRKAEGRILPTPIRLQKCNRMLGEIVVFGGRG